MKFKIFQICFLFALLICFSRISTASEVITIKVSPATEIGADDILLGDVSEISGENHVLIQELRNIRIASVPLPGDEKQIDSNLIWLRLKQHAIDPQQVRLFVPDDAMAIRTAVKVSVEEIRQIVDDYLHKNLPWDLSKVKIGNLDVDSGVVLPKGKIDYRVVPPPKTSFLGPTTLSVIFTVNGNFEKKFGSRLTSPFLSRLS